MPTGLASEVPAMVGVAPDGALSEELNEVAGHLNAQHGRLVDLAVRAIAEPTWVGPGVLTVEQYLAWRVGLSPRRARDVVAIARRAHELPMCIDALRRGELAIDQMAAIAARAPWWIDQEILELGRHLNVTQLRRLLGQYPFPDIAPPVDPGDGAVEFDDTIAVEIAGGDSAEVSAPVTTEPSPDGSVGRGTLGTDRCWFGVGDDGRWRLHAECDPLTGMIIESSLDEARDALFLAGNAEVTAIDALREIAERSLDTVTSSQRRDRSRIHIHLDTDATATDARGWRVPDAIRRHLTCDGLVTPTFVADGLPISVGRTQRAIPERTRRTVIHRDRGCRIPGCTVTHHLEVHHIVHWEDLGPTESWNLIALCPHHHRLHHRGELGIRGNADDPDGIVVTRRDGEPFTGYGARPVPPGAPPSPPRGVYHPPLGERLQMRWVHFNLPPDHATVHARAS